MSPSVDFDRQRETLIKQLRKQKIHDEKVLGAISTVPREVFVPQDLVNHAYDNHALAIGSGQTISQPYIVALMTQALKLIGTERVLEIGTGSGYQAAILAQLCQAVYTVERLPELAERAEQTLSSLQIRNVAFRIGDGTLGWPEEAPFDRIIVTAAAPEAPPALLKQLASDGILVVPVGTPDYQVLTSFTKVGDRLKRESLCECRFVPLIGEEGWAVDHTPL